MSVATNILFFVFMPVFWFALIRVFFVYNRRVNRERRLFESAINPKFHEGWVFLKSLIVLGIVGSLLTALVGVETSLNWILLYELIVAISLLIPWILVPTFLLFGAVLMGVFFNDYSIPMIKGGDIAGAINVNASRSANFLVLITIMLILMFIFLKMNGKTINSPQVAKNRRGNRVASYGFNELAVFPLVLLIPGKLIETVIPMWPVFNIFGAHVTFLVVPFLIGFRLKFINHLPNELMPRISNAIGKLALLAIVLTAIAYFFRNSYYVIFAIILLAIVYALIIYHFHRVDRKTGSQISQAVDGIRIIGIKPNTPADKMGLKTGDLIIEVNNMAVNSESQLYQALQDDPTFVHMKVKNRHNQLEIKETAIYDGSPHEIGIEMFQNN